MSDFRKIIKWQVILPFCFLHIVGSRSLVSSLLLKNFFSKDFIRYNLTKKKQLIEDNFLRSENISQNTKKSEFDKIFSQNQGNTFINNFNERVKKPDIENREILICDNRIDHIDQDFIENVTFEDFCCDSSSGSRPVIVLA